MSSIETPTLNTITDIFRRYLPILATQNKCTLIKYYSVMSSMVMVMAWIQIGDNTSTEATLTQSTDVH